MKKKVLFAIVLIGIVCVCSLIVIKSIFFKYPDTLTAGEDPELTLPLTSFANNTYIGGYGTVPLGWHNGIDFGVNGSTVIVAPHNAYIDFIECWYNDGGGHWQTNVRLWLNYQWNLEIVFESWALNESYGQLQRDAIIVNTGQFVSANQPLGTLLCHGEGAHIHFQVSSNNVQCCPYTYFSASAKAAFAAQFYLVNYTPYWCG